MQRLRQPLKASPWRYISDYVPCSRATATSERYFSLSMTTTSDATTQQQQQQQQQQRHGGGRRRRRRVVITGMGAVSPLGNTLQTSWNALVDGDDVNGELHSGMTTLEEALKEHQNISREQLDREWKIAKTLPCQVVAPVKNLAQEQYYDNKKNARFVQMALLAGKEAMENANLIDWLKNNEGHDRFGVCVGSGMSGVREITHAYNTITNGKDLLLSDDDDNIPSIRKLSPHFIPKVLTNSASGRLSLEFGLKGPNLATSTACAAGTHAIGDGFRAIQYGTIDLCLAGGSEASIEPIGLAGFCRLRALSTNTIPEISSRPFDIARDGFVMGEGAAMLVLEELEHAKVRGATILAEISGYGMSGDAFHITAPDEEGIGAERAMKMALEDAQNNRNDMENPLKVGYVNAHATSTPKGDEIEAMVIDRVLRNSLDSNDENSLITPYVSSIKGATGHLLGAAGALEAALTVMSIVHQRIPPTLNLEQVDWNGNEESRCCFEHVRGDAITPAAKLKAAISNSFGFGGTNASLLFCKYEDDGDGHI